MRDIRIAAAQFEAQDADKEFNFGRMADLTARATAQGAEIVSFHECCITGYTFLQTLARDEVAALAEPVPDGPSTRRLIDLARDFGVALLAGLVERDEDKLYNTYVAVTPEGFVAKHRKLHPFIHPELIPGPGYAVFDLVGVRCGILICYDNNLPENARVLTLMGADVIFAPHVTGGLPSPMPGRGTIDRKLWENRDRDPVALRMEFMGPKGRGWLMRWLPARAFENGVYCIFTNAVGIDHDTIKPGNAMVLDPFGEILTESNALGDDVVVGLCTAEKIELSGGRRYIKARRPDLYDKLVEPLPPGQSPRVHPGWRVVSRA
ncbi:MAG: nitrilase family protein [Planctomycetota bacterium]